MTSRRQRDTGNFSCASAAVYRSRLGAALVIMALAGARAWAQTDGGFDLRWNTVDGGGAALSSAGNFQFAATIGQPDAGTLTAPGWTFNGGFWGGVLVLSAAATLSNDLTATDATVSVDDLGQFPDSGTIQIDNELMTYNGKQPLPAAHAEAARAGAQPGKLLNVQRGVNGTTPVPHHEGTAIVLLGPKTCAGDCDHRGAVTVNELITMVNAALGNADVSACNAGDADSDGQITVDEILAAVNHAVSGCTP